MNNQTVKTMKTHCKTKTTLINVEALILNQNYNTMKTKTVTYKARTARTEARSMRSSLKLSWNQSDQEVDQNQKYKKKSGLNPWLLQRGDPPPTLRCSSGSCFPSVHPPLFLLWSKLQPFCCGIMEGGTCCFFFFVLSFLLGFFFFFEGGVHSCLP